MSRKKQKTEMEWLSAKKKQLTFEGEDCKGSRLRRHFVDTTQLKFSNLLKEETIFLKKLTNLEKFNFESDFKVNGRRIRDAKVCRFEIEKFKTFIYYITHNIYNIQIHCIKIFLFFQPIINKVANDGLQYIKKRKRFWKEIPQVQ